MVGPSKTLWRENMDGLNEKKKKKKKERRQAGEHYLSKKVAVVATKVRNDDGMRRIKEQATIQRSQSNRSS